MALWAREEEMERHNIEIGSERIAMVRHADRGKFVELAKKRVSKALKDIQLIGNLSNRSNYDYTEEDVAKITKALSDEVLACRKKFEMAMRKQTRPEFELE